MGASNEEIQSVKAAQTKKAEWVELLVCAAISIASVVVHSQMRVVRVVLLCSALWQWWRWRRGACDHVGDRREWGDQRMREAEDMVGVCTGALLPIALAATVAGPYGAVCLAASLATVCGAMRGRVQWYVCVFAGVCAGIMAVSGMDDVELSDAVVVGAVPVMQWLLVAGFERSFTVGEASLVSGAFGCMFVQMNRGAGVAERMNAIDAPMLLASPATLVVLRALRYGRRWGMMAAGAVYVPLYWALWRVVGAEPVGVVVLYFLRTKTRRALVAGWVLIVTTAMVVARCVRVRHEGRKVFHVAAAIVFTTGVIVDAEATATASAVALAVLTAAGDALTTMFPQLVDIRDGGDVAVSHLYLLAACATPLWTRMWPSLGGVAVVCVLDGVAAIVGRRFGRTPFGRNRSVEGTMAGFLAVLTMTIVVYGDMPSLSLLLALLATAAVEASTAQLDNLVLPLVLYAALAAWPS